MLQYAGRGLLLALALVVGALFGPSMAGAAPYAAFVMDARDGRVLHAENADTRLHPASLTKMMTLYLAFDAVKRGQLRLDQRIPISRYAASKPPSKLGLRAGSSIELRYLIRASAVKSANDAAAAIAEAISGSEAAFAEKMTATARTMGLTRTTFKNASGLTQSGHLSTARDMAELGRRMFYDFPEYYNLFSRLSTDAKIKTVANTNRRLLNAYRGADGIKTGYTRAAGYNLVASAERGNKRVIVSMFGGTSTAARNEQVAKLMDFGLSRMRTRVAVVKPRRIRVPDGPQAVRVALAQPAVSASTPDRAPRPTVRPRTVVAVPTTQTASIASVRQPVLAREIADAVERAVSDPSLARVSTTSKAPDAAAVEGAVRAAALTPANGMRTDRPRRRPAGLSPARIAVHSGQGSAPSPAKTVKAEATNWVVELGGTHEKSRAERLLLTTALQELEALEGSKRVMAPTGSPGWYKARFVGLDQASAQAACARLAARQTPCEVYQGG